MENVLEKITASLGPIPLAAILVLSAILGEPKEEEETPNNENKINPEKEDNKVRPKWRRVNLCSSAIRL